MKDMVLNRPMMGVMLSQVLLMLKDGLNRVREMLGLLKPMITERKNGIYQSGDQNVTPFLQLNKLLMADILFLVGLTPLVRGIVIFGLQNLIHRVKNFGILLLVVSNMNGQCFILFNVPILTHAQKNQPIDGQLYSII